MVIGIILTLAFITLAILVIYSHILLTRFPKTEIGESPEDEDIAPFISASVWKQQ